MKDITEHLYKHYVIVKDIMVHNVHNIPHKYIHDYTFTRTIIQLTREWNLMDIKYKRFLSVDQMIIPTLQFGGYLTKMMILEQVMSF